VNTHAYIHTHIAALGLALPPIPSTVDHSALLAIAMHYTTHTQNAYSAPTALTHTLPKALCCAKVFFQGSMEETKGHADAFRFV
jgi:hypothetical protein